MATDPVKGNGRKVDLGGMQISPARTFDRLPAIGYSGFGKSVGSRKGAVPEARRVVNIVLALIGIVLALPIGIVVALLILLTSPGPIIYSQTRIGVDRRRWRGALADDPRRQNDWGGRPFKIYKFRTMTWNPGEKAQVWARNDDPRITPIGRFLRRSRLDELPQLYNVLKGDMNVVGPRPEQPQIFKTLREQIDGYADRQRVLPGLTGLAQVSQSYDSDLEDVRSKIAYDLEYIRSQSVARDLAIIAKTFPVVLTLKGGVPRK